MDKYQPEAITTLHNYFFLTRTDPPIMRKAGEQDGQAKYVPNNAELVVNRGRPDIMAARGGRCVFVEVKNDDTSFAFKDLRQDQRDWIERFGLPAPYSTPVWIWLVLGPDPPHRDATRYNPRKTWLLPYSAFLKAEADLAPYQDSIPYLAGKGYNRDLQEKKLDAVHLLEKWELKWAGKGAWTIPVTHPFYRWFIEPLPLYVVKEATANVTHPNHLSTSQSAAG